MIIRRTHDTHSIRIRISLSFRRAFRRIDNILELQISLSVVVGGKKSSRSEGLDMSGDPEVQKVIVRKQVKAVVCTDTVTDILLSACIATTRVLRSPSTTLNSVPSLVSRSTSTAPRLCLCCWKASLAWLGVSVEGDCCWIQYLQCILSLRYGASTAV